MKHFAPGHFYPLKDGERFDDEYGIGFSHVAVPEGMDPGTCYIIDMWPVDPTGHVHPGYNASPIPIHATDVDLGAGRPISFSLPARKNVLDAFC